MKIALLQCNTVTGDVAGNAERILAAVREAAAQGADLCVTPELALCGVAPGSYLRAEDFAEGCKAGLQMLADALQDGPPLLVGAPVASVYASGLLSNAAILVQKGRWSVVSRKVYQTYGQDSEARFFDRGVSCGILALDGWRLGVVLCQESATEDGAFWKTQYASGHNPLMELVQRGVDAIVHMAAVPFSKGVQRLSEQMLSHVAARHHVHLFSVNMVGGNDSRVYNGQSLAFDPTGQILARGKAFAEDVLLVDTAGSGGIVHPRPACLPEAIWDALTLGVRDFVRKCGLEKAIVALSGGMDSALVLCVAAEALGADNVTAVLMPSPYSSEGSVTDSLELAKNLGVRTLTLPIEPVMESFSAALAPGLDLFETFPGDTTFENLQARIRGVIVMASSNSRGLLAVATGNKSELACGYSTIYGDAVGGYAPIKDLLKTRVWEISRWRNKAAAAGVGIGGLKIVGNEDGNTGIPLKDGVMIPVSSIEKAPSAELRPGQKDSDSLPEYALLDKVLAAYIEHAHGRADLLADGFDQVTVDTVMRLVDRAEWKRRQYPLGPKVTALAFGRDRRLPVTNAFRE